MAESEGELKSLLMRVKKKSEKVGLKFSIQKTNIMTSCPTTSWQTEVGKVETMTDFIFLGSKITADIDCSWKIKRHLLLGRKAMTNLDSILKCRDITLLTIHIVKALVFPVVIYRCESWTIKKAEHRELMLLNCDAREDSWESLRLQGAQPVNPKENQPRVFIGRTDAEAETAIQFGHLIQRADSLEKILILGKIEGKRRRGRLRMKWLDSINGHEFEQTQGDSEGQGRLACCSPWGLQRVGHNLMTEQQQ